MSRNTTNQSCPNVSVICRFRPMNELEKTNGNETAPEFTSPTSLTFHSIREKNVYRFNFDRIFPPSSTQKEVYDFGVKGIINSVLDGYNGTVLAYGQTSSGKTYTMEGRQDEDSVKGIIPRMIEHVFEHIYASEGIDFMLKVSFMEIYQEKVRDLIDPERVNLNIREDAIKGIFVEGVSENYVSSPDDVLQFMKLGSQNRAQAATNMNEHSSRSHSIFMLSINQSNKKEGVSKTGKLFLVDLAGSEKISKTGATGHTLEEAKIINKSLTTLGRVINSLTDGKSTHIPYRESKLTRILQESLGGNSKTCLIITCSPSIYNESESLSTLRFGERAKKIKNKPKINKEVTVEELQRIINQLKEKLRKAEARINQLESFINQKGLPVPEGEYELEESKSKKREDREREKVDENKLIEEIKERLNKEGNSPLENLTAAISNLEDNDDLFVNNEAKLDIIGLLKVVKGQYEEKENAESTKIKSLQEELTTANEIKGKLQQTLIENETKYLESTSSKKILDTLKTNGYQKSISPAKAESLSFANQCVKENRAIQTEKFDSEIEKINEKFQNEKNILLKTVDEQKELLERMNLMQESKDEKIKSFENIINLGEKEVKNKNVILETNLKDMRKKYEKISGEKLLLENSNRSLKKNLIDKVKELEGIIKENADLKEKLLGKSQLANAPANMIKVIQGGAGISAANKIYGSNIKPKVNPKS